MSFPHPLSNERPIAAGKQKECLGRGRSDRNLDRAATSGNQLQGVEGGV